MNSFFYFGSASFFEIAGCFAFWSVLRLGRSPIWLATGVVSLILFAWVLTRVDTSAAGRSYATYGGVYIVASLFWLWLVESRLPDRWDITGGVLCLLGAGVIFYGPRA